MKHRENESAAPRGKAIEPAAPKFAAANPSEPAATKFAAAKPVKSAAPKTTAAKPSEPTASKFAAANPVKPTARKIAAANPVKSAARKNAAAKPVKSAARKLAAAAACMILFAGALAAGYYTAPEDTRLPVLLANGEVILQPCYVAVDGECIALVKNEKTAEEVVDRVKEEYKNASTTEVKIEEKTSIEKLDLKNGSEKPEILTARAASEQIVEKKSLTVRTKELVEVDEEVAYKTIEKETDQLNAGKVCVKQQGQNGLKHITKEVIKENGKVIDERVISQETVRKTVPQITLCGTAGMAPPLDSLRLTSGFGARWGRQHEGVDLGMAAGTPVYAAKNGVVSWSGYVDGYGNLVKIDHGDGIETYYAHCSRLDVEAGQSVEAGQQIAAVGSTGNSTGPHLHFEVRINGVAQDPAQWLSLE